MEKVDYTFADGHTAKVSPKAAAVYAQREQSDRLRAERTGRLTGTPVAGEPTKGLSRADVREIVRAELGKLSDEITAAVKLEVEEALAARADGTDTDETSAETPEGEPAPDRKTPRK